MDAWVHLAHAAWLEARDRAAGPRDEVLRGARRRGRALRWRRDEVGRREGRGPRLSRGGEWRGLLVLLLVRAEGRTRQQQRTGQGRGGQPKEGQRLHHVLPFVTSPRTAHNMRALMPLSTGVAAVLRRFAEARSPRLV